MGTTYLAGMGSNSMTELRDDLAGLRESLCCERLELVTVLLVASEGEHLGAETHKLDTILIVPPYHLSNVTGISQAQGLDIFLTSSNIGWLTLVWAILRRVFRLRGVLERVAML